MENLIEIIIGGLKKFGSEIVFFILLALAFSLFPGLKRQYNKFKWQNQNETEAEIQKQLELLQQEEKQLAQLKEVLKTHDEVLKQTEYQTAEEAHRKAEIQKKLDENLKEEKRVKAEIQRRQEALRQEEARKAEEARQKAEIERKLEEQRREKERLRAEIKQKEKALEQVELRKAEEARQRAEAQKQLEAQRQKQQVKQEEKQLTPSALRIMLSTTFLLLLGSFFYTQIAPDEKNSGFLIHFAACVTANTIVSAITGWIVAVITHAIRNDNTEADFTPFFRGSVIFFCFFFGLAYFLGWRK